MAATLFFVGAVSADSDTGVKGNFQFTDSASTPGAKCGYYLDHNYTFHTMNVAPPSAWWPDRSTDSNTEHGTVGWSFKLQRSPDTSNWETIKTSPIQKATAYEDSQAPYGSATKAHFTRMKLNVDASKTVNYLWRAEIKVTWFKKSGAVLGTVTHDVVWYQANLGTHVGVSENYCYGGTT